MSGAWRLTTLVGAIAMVGAVGNASAAHFAQEACFHEQAGDPNTQCVYQYSAQELMNRVGARFLGGGNCLQVWNDFVSMVNQDGVWAGWFPNHPNRRGTHTNFGTAGDEVVVSDDHGEYDFIVGLLHEAHHHGLDNISEGGIDGHVSLCVVSGSNLD